jgi:hypothetical protein
MKIFNLRVIPYHLTRRRWQRRLGCMPASEWMWIGESSPTRSAARPFRSVKYTVYVSMCGFVSVVGYIVFAYQNFVFHRVTSARIFKPRNRFQGINSASLCSLAGQYENPIPTRFVAPIECIKIPAQWYESNQRIYRL